MSIDPVNMAIINDIVSSMEEAYPQYIKAPAEGIKERNRQLCERIKNGDKEAETELVVRNRLLVKKFTKMYYHGNNYDDAYICGFVGLLRAAQTYDTNTEYTFATYAGAWVRNIITRMVTSLEFSVRLPEHARVKAAKLFMLYGQEGDIAALLSDKEIAEKIDASEELTSNIRAVLKSPLSMQSKFPSNENEDYTFEDIIKSDEDVEEEVSNIELRANMEKCIGKLTEREQQIIYARFGFDGGKVKTLEEIGKEIGLTRERVRQIEERALDKLVRMRDIQELQVSYNIKDIKKRREKIMAR